MRADESGRDKSLTNDPRNRGPQFTHSPTTSLILKRKLWCTEKKVNPSREVGITWKSLRITHIKVKKK